jgi:predicted lipoprotein with Yx(FWY)xxD motif
MRLVLALVAGLSLAAPAAASTVRTSDSQSYGTILVDGRGFTLYAFTKDGRGPSGCFDDCARAWPPLYAKGKLRARGDARQKLLGSVRRGEKHRQVTYRGRPLYYYRGETQAGQIFCQDVFEFGGDWLIVRPNGALVR